MRNVLKVMMLFLLSVTALLSVDFYRFYTHPMLASRAETHDLWLKPGSGTVALNLELCQRSYLEHARDSHYLRLVLRVHRWDHLLKTGEYQITPGMTVPQLLKNMVEGRVIARSVTFIEGKTLSQALQTLSENIYLTHYIHNQAELLSYLHCTYPSAEGLLYPDTYYFARGTSDRKVLKKAYKKMATVLEEEWNQRSVGLPYADAYSALVAASLIEKETGLDAERYQISGVLVRRLQKRMRLQFDPTVLYGLADPAHHTITKSDLAMNTAYNTYLNYGLPPTPIALPSRASIHAALHPDAGNSLYFVARGDGGHVFSDTLEQHARAVQQYRDYLKQKAGG